MHHRLVVVALVGLCVIACSKKDQETGPAPDPLTKAQRALNTLPEGWPSSVPVYPGATITQSSSMPKDKQVVLTSTDGIDKVSAFYKEKLSGFGVKNPSDFDDGERRTVMFTEGTMFGVIRIEKAATGTNVTLTVSPKGVKR